MVSFFGGIEEKTSSKSTFSSESTMGTGLRRRLDKCRCEAPAVSGLNVQVQLVWHRKTLYTRY